MCNCNKPKVNTALPAQSSPRPARYAAPSTASAPPPSYQLKRGSAETAATLPGETAEEKCLALGELLGLPGPVEERVLIAALENNWYARRLFAVAGTPGLQAVLDNPPQPLNKNTPARAFTNARLLAKASTALLKWGFSGFPTVPAETLERRESACLACPSLVDPSSMLQRMTASSRINNVTGYRTGNKTCSACGCVVKNKMRLSTENCPLEDEQSPGLSRWGEPMQPAA